MVKLFPIDWPCQITTATEEVYDDTHMANHSKGQDVTKSQKESSNDT